MKIKTYWYEYSIKNHPDKVETPSNVSNTDRSDLNNDIIRYPIVESVRSLYSGHNS